MQRSPLDKTRSRGSIGRILAYLRADRDEKPHPATVALHRQPHAAQSGRKVAEYLDIDRQDES